MQYMDEAQICTVEWRERSRHLSPLFRIQPKNLYENFGHNKNNKRELLIFYVRSGLIYQFIGIFVGKKGITEFYLVKIRYKNGSVFFYRWLDVDQGFFWKVGPWT